MKTGLYVINDLIAEISGPIFEARNDGVALRGYLEFQAKNKVPADEIELYCVGQIDHETNAVYPELRHVKPTLSLVDQATEKTI